MNKMAIKNEIELTPAGVKKIYRLFDVGSEITELAEDVLNELGNYSEEFINGLKKSLGEFRSGKLKKLKSLKDLK
jgi:hypothetical protein